MARSIKTTESILKAGIASEFWQMMCVEIDKDILKLQLERDSDEIASLSANEYKLAMENIKDQIRLLINLKNKPQAIIQNLENPEEEEEMDPYE